MKTKQQEQLQFIQKHCKTLRENLTDELSDEIKSQLSNHFQVPFFAIYFWRTFKYLFYHLKKKKTPGETWCSSLIEYLKKHPIWTKIVHALVYIFLGQPIQTNKTINLDDLKNETSVILDAIKAIEVSNQWCPVLDDADYFERQKQKSAKSDQVELQAQFLKYDFFGRDEVFEEIDKFLQDERKFCWLSIIGNGGSGKTRLGIELLFRLKKEGYIAGFLTDIEDANVDKLINYKPPLPCVFIIDYATEKISIVNRILLRLSHNTDLNAPVRIILLDRNFPDNKDFKRTDIGQSLAKKTNDAYRLKDSRYIPDHNEHNQLKSSPQKPDDTGKESVSYEPSVITTKSAVSDVSDSLILLSIQEDHINDLIRKVIPDIDDTRLKTIMDEIREKEYSSNPLTIILICLTHKKTNASSGDGTTQNIKTLLDEFGTWQRYPWKNRQERHNIMHDRATSRAVQLATIAQGLKEQHFPLIHTNEKIRDNAIAHASRIINPMYDNDDGDSTIICLNALQPDILGEHFVLSFMKYLHKKPEKLQFTEEQQEFLIRDKKQELQIFLDRAMQDFKEFYNIKELFLTHNERIKEQFSGYFEKETELQQLFSEYYRAVLAQQPKKQLQLFNEFSDAYWQSSQSSETSQLYAQVLFLQSTTTKDFTEARDIVNTLQDLLKQHADNQEITAIYAQGLFNLSTKATNFQETQKVIMTLKDLSEQYADNQEIAVEYAKGLFNLSLKATDFQQAKEIVETLKNLFSKHADNQNIAVEYAKGLFNLSYKTTDFQEVQQVIENLKHLSEQHADDQEIAIEYAKGLVNLSANATNFQQAQVDINPLKHLSKQHADNQEIATLYASGLVNLQIKSTNFQEAQVAINPFTHLFSKHADNQKIATLYAKGLVGLSYKATNFQQAQVAIAPLENLFSKHADNQEIATLYAKGLVNLHLKSTNFQEAQEIVETLKHLSKQHTDNQEITVEYAKSLVNLSYKATNSQQAQVAITPLKHLFSKHANNQEITTLYAKGIFNLSYKTIDFQQAQKAIEPLQDLFKQHADNQEIADLYTKGIFNLSAKAADFQEAQEIINPLKPLKYLSKQHVGNWRITPIDANMLVHLSLKATDFQEVQQAIETLKYLSEQHADNQDMAEIYAAGLDNLSAKATDFKQAQEVIETLKYLSEQYADNQDMAEIYASGLVNLSNKATDFQEVQQAIEPLQDLLKQHADNQEMVNLYAKGLVNLSLKAVEPQQKQKANKAIEDFGKQHPEMISIILELMSQAPKKT